MAQNAPRKKFANSNLNAQFGAPPEAAKAKPSYGPAVRSSALIKPVAKPKGLVSLGKAVSGSSGTVRKGAAWEKFEKTAKEKAEEENAKKNPLASPDWAVIDFNDLDKPLGQETDEQQHEDAKDDGPEQAAPAAGEHTEARSRAGSGSSIQSGRAGQPASRSWADQTENSDEEGNVWTMPAPGQPVGQGPPAKTRLGRPPDSMPPPPPPDAESPAPPLGRAVGPPPPERPPPPGAPPPAAQPPQPPQPAATAPAPPPTLPPTQAEVQSDGRLAFGQPPARPPGPPPPMPPPPATTHAAEFEDSPVAPGPGGHYGSPGQGPAPPPTRGSPGQGPMPPPTYGSPEQRPLQPPTRQPPTRQPPARPPAKSAWAGSAGAPGYPPPAPPLQAGGSPPRSPQNAPASKAPNPPSTSTAGTKGAGKSAGGKGESGKGLQAAPKSAWGPPVTYTQTPPMASFAPRAPQKNVAMTEDFEKSGWKQKTLWSPPEGESRGNRQGRSGGAGPAPPMTPPQAPSASPCMEGTAPAPRHSKVSMTGTGGTGGGAVGPRSKLRADGAELSKPAETQQQDMSPGGVSEPVKHPKIKRPPKEAKDPLEVLDPESSEDEGTDMDDGPPPEYAVLDMTVPRTALVLNVSHVLKRLNGCCSLNQLTKAMTNFKDKCGLSLEAFLRANPMSFHLDGRIVYMLDRDGERWIPPPQQQQQGDASNGQTARGKGGKGGKDGSSPAGKSSGKGGKGAKGDTESNPTKGGKGGKGGKGAAEKTKGGDKAANKAGKGSKGSSKGGGKGKAAKRAQEVDDAAWDSWGWDEWDEWGEWSGEPHWESHGWDEWGETDWKVGGWKGSW